jgi:putative CRISPR-associated protein (TIGR02620 family)
MSADTGIPVDIMKNICKEEYPKTYERISASEALLGGLSTKQEKGYVIVTRHKGLVEWLKLHGIAGEVVEHVTTPEQISGKNVVGVLPLNLAALAATITTVDMALPAEKRGVDLTPEEMDSFGATMNKYRVMKV